MELKSNAFENNGKIPSKYTCDGDNINPQLSISEVPKNAKSLVLIMDDPDIPKEIKSNRGIDVFDHWVVFNISAEITEIFEGQELQQETKGINSAGEVGYRGPCPPQEYEPKEHRYFFKLYALNIILDLDEGVSKKEVETAMQKHIIEKTELIGKYERN